MPDFSGPEKEKRRFPATLSLLILLFHLLHFSFFFVALTALCD
jgi:hypothetical protein